MLHKQLRENNNANGGNRKKSFFLHAKKIKPCPKFCLAKIMWIIKFLTLKTHFEGV
jgi:hypothetical protein